MLRLNYMDCIFLGLPKKTYHKDGHSYSFIQISFSSLWALKGHVKQCLEYFW